MVVKWFQNNAIINTVMSIKTNIQWRLLSWVILSERAYQWRNKSFTLCTNMTTTILRKSRNFNYFWKCIKLLKWHGRFYNIFQFVYFILHYRSLLYTAITVHVIHTKASDCRNVIYKDKISRYDLIILLSNNIIECELINVLQL